MTSHTVAAERLAADEALAELVDDLAARFQAGASIDIEALARAHPEYAERLGPLLPALQALAGMGSPGATNDPPLPAAGVLGDFRIIREVGRGGMGVVYEAHQLSLGGRRVALKVLPFAGMFDPRHLVRFQNEARAAACLHHPHIVPVYAVGCDRGVHYYAMQFIDGSTLAAAIEGFQSADRNTRLDTGSPPEAGVGPDAPAQAGAASSAAVAALSTERTSRPYEFTRTVARLGRQAAVALDHAHQQGIIHRDIKPANLLLDGDQNVWVTDFGLAHFREECGLTRTGEVIGTLRYMSPEQTLGRGVVDQRTDIYSLGVTLYELLTIRPAFGGDDRQELIRRINLEDPPRIRKLNPSVPVELETIVSKAMARAPDARYGSARELADDLERWRAYKPIRARPLGRVQKAWRWSRRHRALVLGLAVSLLLLAAAVVVASLTYAVERSRFADRQSQFAREREAAERELARDLQRVLLGRAEAVRMSRFPGYRSRVWSDLREAASLPQDANAVEQMRAIILECLGDPIGCPPVANPEALPRQKRLPVPADVERKIRDTAEGVIVASPRADHFAAVEQKRLITFRNPQGEKTSPGGVSPLGGIYDLTFTPDGKCLVAGCEQGFFVWGMERGDRWVVSAGNITSVAVSPNGRFLALGGQRLELWSIPASRPIAAFPSPVPGTRVEFSADGRVFLAVVNGQAVAGWNVSDTPERRVLDRHILGVPSVAFKPDGSQLVSVSKDLHVCLWDAPPGEPGGQTRFRHRAEIEAVAFSPDGSRFVTGDFDGTVRVWDTASGATLAEAGQTSTPGQIWRVQFSSNGEHVAAAGVRGVTVWKLGAVGGGGFTLTPVRTITVKSKSQGTVDVAIRPGGTEVVFLTMAGCLYSFDFTRNDLPRLMTGQARGALRALHFAPGGDRLTFLTRESTLGLWDWGKKEATDTGRRAEWIALSPDGRWVALGNPGQTITIADTANGREAFTLPPEGGDIWCLAWSANGTQVSAGLSDGRVVIWNLEEVRARLAEFRITSPSTTVR